MNIVIWLLVGGMLGWVGRSHFGFNENRGPAVAVIIGAVGAFLGGFKIAPAMMAAAADPAAFNVGALAVAVTVAGAAIFASNVAHDRYGF